MTYASARAIALQAWIDNLTREGWTEERINQLCREHGISQEPAKPPESLTAKAERWIPHAVAQGVTIEQIEQSLIHASLPPSDLCRLIDYAADLVRTQSDHASDAVPAEGLRAPRPERPDPPR